MVQDLFTFQNDQELKRYAPLAERLRPKTLDDFVGQQEILGPGTLLRRAIECDRIGNILFQGPPGIGKTTLAKIIAANTRAHFSDLNAVFSGIKELRQEIEAAKKRLGQHGLRTILFIDEVHRFTTAQQDALLPWVENGTFIFIGATTENPYFEVNQALLSRSRVFRLRSLQKKDMYQLLDRALKDQEKGYGAKEIQLTTKAINHLIDVSNGDARSFLNALELAVETTSVDDKGCINIDISIAEESIQERAVLYDKNGDAHFDTISAFIKSLRGSDPDAALFWLAQMLEAGENPRYIFRRMLIAAAEDIGLADPNAIVIIESCASAFDRVGLPEGNYLLSEAALYLACTEKSNSVLGINSAINSVKKSQKQDVPDHLQDSHRDSESSKDGAHYLYPHNFSGNWVSQKYLPKELQREVFWEPTSNGWEGKRRYLFAERKKRQISLDSDSTENQSP